VPHALHCQARTCSGLEPSLAPQAEQTWLVGSNRPTFRNRRPYSAALYSSMFTNADQPASCTDLASRVRARPFTDKSSTVTAWFSRTILVDSLSWKSRRASATLAWARATCTRARSLCCDPSCLRDRSRCARLSFFSARSENFGEAILVPSSSTAKYPRPRSIPHSLPVPGSGRGATSTTNDAKYRPAASRITVTLDGSAGRARDQRTATSPIFGSRSFPLPSTANRLFLVNRTDCRESLRDRNRGGATRGPFRFPAVESTKFR
jgi:hypothetical protein